MTPTYRIETLIEEKDIIISCIKDVINAKSRKVIRHMDLSVRNFADYVIIEVFDKDFIFKCQDPEIIFKEFIKQYKGFRSKLGLWD